MEILKISIGFFFKHIWLLNLLFAVIVVFFERKSPKSAWAWLLLLFLAPLFGFVFYLLLGTDMRKRKMFRNKSLEENLYHILRKQEHVLKKTNMEKIDAQFSRYTDLVLYNMKTSGAVLSVDNEVNIFVEGNALFDKMIEDMRGAVRFIHIQSYILRNDMLFERIIQVLKEKAAQGVEVRILYDAMGCRTIGRSIWKKWNKCGVETVEFFPALFGRFHLRINYRNHRKIVVIDNKVGYIGGFNVGKEYIGLDDKFGYWRDTHLRVVGSGVLGLQTRFILDWNYAAKQNLFLQKKYYEPVLGNTEQGCRLQIISSGPDRSDEQIRDNYLRLIHKAKKSIYIQTPYFIPDEAILSSLVIAVRSGVEVNIMIPCMPDHPFVYWATYSYVGDLVMAGAKCYTYDRGFLHAKGMIIDSEVVCYGTANMDIRSFSLNFEVNTVLYDEAKAQEMERYFIDDLKYCTRISKDIYSKRPLQIRVKEQVSRLLSPLL